MNNTELDSRNIAVSMRKSVENLVISSQDAIGQSISQALTFSGVITQHANQIINQENRNVSRSPSPSSKGTESNNSSTVENEKQSDFSLQVPVQGSGDNLSITSQVESASVNTKSETANKGTGNPSKTSEGPRAKKKSWYSAFYPTYKSRSEDFKKLFKDVPDDERLIVDYSCALQKDILAHGRLYVSQNYLCFYANIFGWETSLSHRWKDVTAITKEKTALVIPNAILICTENEKNLLTSFSGRDKAYLMLFRVWQNALMDQPMSSQEIWQWSEELHVLEPLQTSDLATTPETIEDNTLNPDFQKASSCSSNMPHLLSQGDPNDLVHSCYGEELGFNSDDEEYMRDVSDEEKVVAAVGHIDIAIEASSDCLY
ncbi:GRAM domain-containing protein 1B [Eumeta japonica]|uniref:GRAM domain-containing protein 1B n=1 Tax=Eumeta variegata TaxID=151549 RepID=A0A4C1WSZ1_EUMVA|nr:GRAM domain-containing protein 1B [Eumeta japonica]